MKHVILNGRIRIGQEFGFTPVLHHVSEGWKVADAIAEAGAPCSLIAIDSLTGGSGDDRLTGGRVPSTQFTHGTSEQRMKWFRQGYESGDPARCDTSSP